MNGKNSNRKDIDLDPTEYINRVNNETKSNKFLSFIKNEKYFEDPIQKIPDINNPHIKFNELETGDQFIKRNKDLKDTHPELKHIEQKKTVLPAVYNKEEKKLSYNKTTVAIISIIVVIAIIVASIFTVWFFSMNMSDYSIRESEYQEKLEKKFKDTEEDYESLEKSITKVLNENYKYDSSEVSHILWKIESFNDQQQKEDWFNPYSGTYLEDYETRKDIIYDWETKIKELMVNNYVDKINSYEADSDEVLKANEFIASNEKDNLDYTPADLDKAQKKLEEVYTLSQNLAGDEASFNIFSDKDQYQQIVQQLENIISNTEVLYKASLMKELYDGASEKAQKEYDEKVEELTKQIRENVEKELTESMNAEYNETLTEKDSRINFLEQDISSKNNEINSLKAKISELENQIKNTPNTTSKD